MSRIRYVGVALVAGTVGAAVALLLAPDSGRNTRRRLARRFERERAQVLRRTRRLTDDAAAYIDHKVDEANEQIDRLVKDGKKALGHVAEEAADQLDAGRKKVSKLIR